MLGLTRRCRRCRLCTDGPNPTKRGSHAGLRDISDGRIGRIAAVTNLLIDDLKREIAKGKVLAICGTGTSIAATGSALASWKGLLTTGVQRCVDLGLVSDDADWAARALADIEKGMADDLIAAAQKITARLKGAGPGAFARWLRETVGSLRIKTPSVPNALAALPIKLATTNYDSILTEATKLPPVTWRGSSRLDRVLRGDEGAILHLAGAWEDPESVVLDATSYALHATDELAQFVQRVLRATHTLLFVGFGQGLSDPNLKALLAWAGRVLPKSEYRHYRLVRSSEIATAQKEHPVSEGIYAIAYGDRYEDLGPFLLSLCPDEASKQTTLDVAPAKASPSLRQTVPRGGLSRPFMTTQSPVKRQYLPIDLPPNISVLVGRENELSQIRNPNARVISINGLGGQGKSALAGYYFRQADRAGEFDFSEWNDCKEQSDRLQTQLVSLAVELSNDTVAASDLANEDFESVVDAFFSFLGKKRCLLVFDNIDSYVDLETQRPIHGMGHLFNAALRYDHKSKFIFTCRPPIQALDEGFTALALSGFNEAETERLLQVRGVRMSGASDRDLVRRLQALSHGHVMWLSLMAIQVARGKYTLEQLVQNFEKAAGANLPEAVLNSIWAALNEKERLLLRCMAELTGPESENRLREIGDAIIRANQLSKALHRLDQFGLVTVRSAQGSDDTLGLHPLVREFVRRKFSSAEREKFQEKITPFFDRMINKFHDKIRTRLPLVILRFWTSRTELSLNVSNHKRALENLLDTSSALMHSGYPEELVRLGARLFNELDWERAVESESNFDVVFGRFLDALAHLGRDKFAETFLEKYETIVAKRSPRYIHLCNMRCYLYWCVEDYETAVKWGALGHEIKTSMNIDTQFDCQHNLALARRDLGQVEPALQYFLQGRTIESVVADAEKDHTTLTSHAAVYGNIARCLFKMSDTANALKLLKLSGTKLDHENDANTLVNQGWASFWIGECLEQLNDLPTAYIFFDDARFKWARVSPHRAERAAAAIQRLTGAAPSQMGEDETASFCRRWMRS